MSRFSPQFRIAAVSGAILAAVSACTHAPKSVATGPAQPLPKQVSVYHLHKLIPYTLRVRRPASPGANPKVGPGGIDYRSEPLPDAHFDCETATWLFRELKLADIRSCLAPLKSLSVSYRVKWLPVPYLELDAGDETPECLKSTLSSIPVPREIFFQSNEDDRLECYSSRLNIESNEIADFKLPIAKTAVKVEFPLLQPPKDDDETRMLLLTWALTPFWDRSDGTLLSHLVPDTICGACLGEKTKLGPTSPKPLSWPE